MFDSWVGKILWKRARQPIPVFLPGESHGQKSLVGSITKGHTHTHTNDLPMLSILQLVYYKAFGKNL